jgi:uncharacterized integral membrane protein (TIGR00698 family)
MLPKVTDLKGISSAVIIGVAALFLSAYTPSYLNSILIALIIGIVLNNLIAIPKDVESGLTFTSSKMLELSIIFLAFSINYVSISKLGVGSFSSILITVTLVLIAIIYFSRVFKCPTSTGWLIGFGTAICGSSAIAALAPSVSKDKEDVAVSMAVVNLYGSIGMILLPLLLPYLQLSTNQIGLLIGGSLHSVGNVVGAGYGMSDEIGEVSMTIKLARVALLSPALIFFNYLVNRNAVNSWKEYIKLPWYLIGFFIISILTSFIPLSTEFISSMEYIGKVVLTIAMAAIGLKVSFKKLISSGRKGIIFGLFIFALQFSLLLGFALFVA